MNIKIRTVSIKKLKIFFKVNKLLPVKPGLGKWTGSVLFQSEGFSEKNCDRDT